MPVFYITLKLHIVNSETVLLALFFFKCLHYEKKTIAKRLVPCLDFIQFKALLKTETSGINPLGYCENN